MNDTGLTAEQLAAWWPEVSQRLAGVLLARGLAGADVADTLQDVAVRALAHRPAVADAEELSRWAYTVGRNLAVDRHRRYRPVEGLTDGQAALPEVGRVVEGRLEWERTLRAMSSLSAADRESLLATLTGAPRSAVRRVAVRDAVRLHRARSRLLARLGKAGALLAAAWRAVRKAAGLTPAPVTTAAALVVVAVMVLSPGMAPRSDGMAPRLGLPRAAASEPDADPAELGPGARLASVAIAAVRALPAAALRPSAAPPVAPPPPTTLPVESPVRLAGPINRPESRDRGVIEVVPTKETETAEAVLPVDPTTRPQPGPVVSRVLAINVRTQGL
ncbi:MAG TPA: sigma-70 family RNA polymerase sigma factor [Acidimicrobiales bacterium]|nr:sigma-70 family RNA polymerase sigma factor [Acidimicrobiales bacterium]